MRLKMNSPSVVFPKKPPNFNLKTYTSWTAWNPVFRLEFDWKLGRFCAEHMGLTNFILTVAGVSAVVLLLRSDVKQSAAIFRRNVKHIRQWLEEESSAASK